MSGEMGNEHWYLGQLTRIFVSFLRTPHLLYDVSPDEHKIVSTLCMCFKVFRHLCVDFIETSTLFKSFDCYHSVYDTTKDL